MTLFTRNEAAQQLGVSTATLDLIRATGQIGYIQHRPGAKVWFRQSDLDTFLARSTHPPTPTPRFQKKRS